MLRDIDCVNYIIRKCFKFHYFNIYMLIAITMQVPKKFRLMLYNSRNIS